MKGGLIWIFGVKESLSKEGTLQLRLQALEGAQLRVGRTFQVEGRACERLGGGERGTLEDRRAASTPGVW